MPANARTNLLPEFICSGLLMIWHRLDELPSVQAERIVAKAMSDVIHRETTA